MAARKRFTQLQGQYLAFINTYRCIHGTSPAELDIQLFFGVTPPSVHDMVKRLHEAGLVSRVPGQARSLRVLIDEEDIPALVPRSQDNHGAVSGRRARSTVPQTPAKTSEPDFFVGEFPQSEVFLDCCGTRREFAFELLELQSGYFIRATERTAGEDGYSFAAHAESDKYLALGRIRQRINEGLATRYLTRHDGHWSLTHDVAVGHIAADGVVVDGRHIGHAELAAILSAHEGWQFKLRVVDPYEAF